MDSKGFYQILRNPYSALRLHCALNQQTHINGQLNIYLYIYIYIHLYTHNGHTSLKITDFSLVANCPDSGATSPDHPTVPTTRPPHLEEATRDEQRRRRDQRAAAIHLGSMEKPMEKKEENDLLSASNTRYTTGVPMESEKKQQLSGQTPVVDQLGDTVSRPARPLDAFGKVFQHLQSVFFLFFLLTNSSRCLDAEHPEPRSEASRSGWRLNTRPVFSRNTSFGPITDLYRSQQN